MSKATTTVAQEKMSPSVTEDNTSLDNLRNVSSEGQEVVQKQGLQEHNNLYDMELETHEDMERTRGIRSIQEWNIWECIRRSGKWNIWRWNSDFSLAQLLAWAVESNGGWRQSISS